MSDVLSERNKKLLILFKVAIEKEQEAQAFYKKILDICEDKSICKIIDEIILQEKGHEKLLLKHYNDLRRSDEFKD